MNKQKPKKPRPLQLGPLNLAKTHYRPYLAGPHKKSKQNLLWMGPADNMIFDIPPVEETNDGIQCGIVQRLRGKIEKYLQEKSNKMKQQWIFYIRKANIVASVNPSWKEVESFLLKIICQFIEQLKVQNQVNEEFAKQKQSEIDSCSFNLFRKSEQGKMFDKSLDKFNKSIAVINKLPQYSSNNYSTIAKNISNLTHHQSPKNKVQGKSQYRQNSIYTAGQNGSPNMENTLHFKISKLQKEIVLYQQKIKNIENQNQNKLKLMQQKLELKMDMKYSETMQEKMKYENEVENKKFYNDILAQQFKVLKAKYSHLQAQNEQLQQHLKTSEQQQKKIGKLNQFRQLWLMQHEETLQKHQELMQLRQQKETEVKKNKGLKQKLKELSKNFNYNYNVSMENEKDKEDLNKVLKDFRDWLKFFAVPRISKGMMNNNTFFPEMVFQSKQSYTNLLPKDDETNYKLLRPNFFIYFQAYEGIIMAEKKFPQRKVMPPSYYLTIRAIFDSMFLHFNFTTDYKSWHNFPQFAISFIEKFEINLETKKPTLRKSPCQSEQKINFILNVFNIDAANSWQCQIFRGFIMQQFTLDEVYFYLDCRDTLLRGSHLNNNLGSFDPITYIRISIAQDVIKQKMKNYDREMIERMKRFLNSKKKQKNGKDFIDINFVLKLLLEVYSIEKIKSQRFFHNNFKNKAPNSKISYTQYSSFMGKNFQFLTKTDIAKLYRQMYTLGVSHITYKTIHYVCSMKGLFIPLLRFKMSSKNEIWSAQKNKKIFEDTLFSDLQNNLHNMTHFLQDYGLEEIIETNVSASKFLLETQNLRLNKAIFYNRLLTEFEKILKVRLMISWKNQKNAIYEQVSKDEVREKLSQIFMFTRYCNDDLISIRKWRENREKAILKLTKNFKIRIQQSMAEFKAIDKEELQSKLVKLKQKSENLSKEEQSEKQNL